MCAPQKVGSIDFLPLFREWISLGCMGLQTVFVVEVEVDLGVVEVRVHIRHIFARTFGIEYILVLSRRI